MKTVDMPIAFLRPSVLSVQRRNYVARNGDTARTNACATSGPRSSYSRCLAQIASISDGGFMGSLDIRTPTAA